MLLSVFSQGDKGTSWYIIWKGSVNVVTHGRVSPAASQPLHLTGPCPRAHGQGLGDLPGLPCLGHSPRGGSVLVRADVRLQGLVTTLHEGDDFGQLALVNDAPRAATIILREDNCHFLRVDKQDFNRIIKVPLLRVGRAVDQAGTLLWRSVVRQVQRTWEEQG